MRLLYILLILLIPTGGCTSFKHSAEQVEVMEPASPIYEEQELDPLVEEAALKVASHYPPGRTILHLTVSDNDFGWKFEAGLRAQGFQLSPETTDPNVLDMSMLFDNIGNSTLYYLHVKSSDGWSFGQVYNLTLEGFEKASLLTQTPAFFEFVGSDAKEVESPLIKTGQLFPEAFETSLSAGPDELNTPLSGKPATTFKCRHRPVSGTPSPERSKGSFPACTPAEIHCA